MEEKARLKRKEQLARLEGLCFKPKLSTIDGDNSTCADDSNYSQQNQEEDEKEHMTFTFEDNEWQELQLKADDTEVVTYVSGLSCHTILNNNTVTSLKFRLNHELV